MESNKITPFGEYGINITDYREGSISKTDVTRLRDCEYLMDRGCYFDIYKWDGNKTYDRVLTFDGDNFTKETSGALFNGIPSMHMWFETLEDLQKWLGQYYDSAIACMLAPISETSNGYKYLNTQYNQNPNTWISGSVIGGISGTIQNWQNSIVSPSIGTGTGNIQHTSMQSALGSSKPDNTDEIDEMLKGL